MKKILKKLETGKRRWVPDNAEASTSVSMAENPLKAWL